MRSYASMFELRPSLIGTISTIGGTALGAPVDTQGFADVLATLVAGAVYGSGTGSTITLAIKVQESASLTGTGSAWSDITDGAIMAGSFDFDTITITGTDFGMYQQQQFERMSDGNRKRYLRAHATLAGTVGLGPKFAVSFLLGRAVSSIYAYGGTTIGTGNSQFTKLL
jgi:hypothetical protein